MVKHQLQQLEIHNLTCFKSLQMKFSPGINIFIGENGTGKTHLFKVLFSIMKSFTQPHTMLNGEGLTLLTSDYRLEKYLKSIFKVQQLNELISFGETMANFELSWYNRRFSFEIDNKGLVNNASKITIEDDVSIVYIPPNEVLSWFEGFTAAYEKRESSIDETYYLLAKALELLPLKDSGKSKANSLVKDILEKSGISAVSLDGGKFKIGINNTPSVSAQLMAQGLNKIAQLVHLVMNGSINEKTVLFWDEPESGLNPKHVSSIVAFLKLLSSFGVQSFIATHDYLLIHQLSLDEEYRDFQKGHIPEMKFFSLFKGEGDTKIESSNSLVNIENNPILDEYSALYDLESLLYKKSMNV